MKAREPLWSIEDLAENKKVSCSTLRDRMRAMPLESRQLGTPLPAGKFGKSSKTNRYHRSMLLEWFLAQDAAHPFKRKA